MTNPVERPEAYKILQASGIYTLVGETETNTQLTLESSGLYLQMNEFAPIAAALFLGLLPVTDSGTFSLSYTLQNQQETHHYRHLLPMFKRTSPWEFFVKPFSKTETELAIEGLPLSAREEINGAGNNLGDVESY